ncbi:hypothetical protein ACMFMF_001492 [Clarireedia jacksonii]
MTLSDSDLQSLYAFAVDLSHRAGKILMDGVEARCSGEAPALHEAEKLNAVDIVTQTDLDAGEEGWLKLWIDGREAE